MIRSMARSDKTVVMELIEATDFFRPDELHVAEELVDIYLNHPDQKDYEVVVIESEEHEVAGYMTWGPTALTVGTYDLYWMAVSPKHQGKGYGRKLVEWLEAKVAELKGRMIIVETSSMPKYDPTRRFYLGLNYREIARIPDFYQPGDDRIIYIKQLGLKEKGD
jgi:ribosomal protein S18 acetylase RimI-like enzyme